MHPNATDALRKTIAPLPARTIKEAHRYADLNPCQCGHADRLDRGALSFSVDRVVKTHRWPCSACNAPRYFAFIYPESDDYMQADGYGIGDEPSQILDAGQFLAISDHYATSVPANPRDDDARQRAIAAMREAIYAMEEVLKFIGPGPRDRPNASALVSDESKEFLAHMPGQFERVRLEARLDAYRALLKKFSNPEERASSTTSSSTSDAAPGGAEAIPERINIKIRRRISWFMTLAGIITLGVTWLAFWLIRRGIPKFVDRQGITLWSGKHIRWGEVEAVATVSRTIRLILWFGPKTYIHNISTKEKKVAASLPQMWVKNWKPVLALINHHIQNGDRSPWQASTDQDNTPKAQSNTAINAAFYLASLNAAFVFLPIEQMLLGLISPGMPFLNLGLKMLLVVSMLGVSGVLLARGRQNNTGGGTHLKTKISMVLCLLTAGWLALMVRRFGLDPVLAMF